MIVVMTTTTAKQTGRPRQGIDARSARLTIALSATEKDTVRQAARHAGLTPSEYVRDRLIQPPPPFDLS